MCETYFLVIPEKDRTFSPGILIASGDCGPVTALGSQAVAGWWFTNKAKRNDAKEGGLAPSYLVGVS